MKRENELIVYIKNIKIKDKLKTKLAKIQKDLHSLELITPAWNLKYIEYLNCSLELNKVELEILTFQKDAFLKN